MPQMAPWEGIHFHFCLAEHKLRELLTMKTNAEERASDRVIKSARVILTGVKDAGMISMRE